LNCHSLWANRVEPQARQPAALTTSFSLQPLQQLYDLLEGFMLAVGQPKGSNLLGLLLRSLSLGNLYELARYLKSPKNAQHMHTSKFAEPSLSRR
jgi:hypothetical protein